MRLFSSAQMRAADAAAAASGISGHRLMEAAGAAVADRLTELFPDTRRVLVLCGAGNNGGDGYVAARLLRQQGMAVTVLELVDVPSTSDAAAARAALVATGAEPRPLSPTALGDLLAEARTVPRVVVDAVVVDAVVVDAVLGCGLDRPLTGTLAEVAELVNASGAPVLSVDVPTGVSADSPLLPGPHIRADVTVQLAGAKLASAFYPARQAYTRDLAPDVAASVVDIGIPETALEELSSVTLLTRRWCARWLPSRSPLAHKYTVGTVVVVGGSSSYAGAAELACRGAWRGGAGLVTLVGGQRHPAAWPETVYRSLTGEWPPAGLADRAAGSCVVGPGLGPEAAALVRPVLRWAPGPVVIDAGALAPDVLWPALERPSLDGPTDRTTPAEGRAAPELILTPHAGEAARLLETTAAVVDADPLEAALDLSRRSGAIVVLKGATTVIASPDGQAAVSTRGHPGMASGGTGDVLAGLIGALVAAPGTRTGPALFGRTCLAVFAHGLAGERAAAASGVSLTASDLVDAIAGALTELAP